MTYHTFYRLVNHNGYGLYCADECEKTFNYLNDIGYAKESQEHPVFKSDYIKFNKNGEWMDLEWTSEDSNLIYAFSSLTQMLDWFPVEVLLKIKDIGEIAPVKVDIQYPNYYIEKKQAVIKKSEYLNTKKIPISYDYIFEYQEKIFRLSKEPKYPTILLNKFSEK